METRLLFDLGEILIVVRKSDSPFLFFRNPGRRWDGFVYFEQGDGIFTGEDGERRPVKDGSLVLLWEKQAYTLESFGPCTYITTALHFLPGTVGPRQFPIIHVCHAAEKKLLSELPALCESGRWDAAAECRIRLLSFYLQILRQSGSFPQPENPTVRRAADYLRENFRRRVSVEALARYCSVSESGLHTLFRRWMGDSIAPYQEVLRIENAKNLLSLGLCGIKEVAQTLGYVDASHFSRNFRKITGMSPGAFLRGNGTAHS